MLSKTLRWQRSIRKLVTVTLILPIDFVSRYVQENGGPVITQLLARVAYDLPCLLQEFPCGRSGHAWECGMPSACKGGNKIAASRRRGSEPCVERYAQPNINSFSLPGS